MTLAGPMDRQRMIGVLIRELRRQGNANDPYIYADEDLPDRGGSSLDIGIDGHIDLGELADAILAAVYPPNV